MPRLESAERLVYSFVGWVQIGVEIVSALIIVVGVCLAVAAYIRQAGSGRARDYTSVRLVLAHQLVIALEFQLAADILATAVAPSWDAVGKLAAIAAIRTLLNHFLLREMNEEVRHEHARHRGRTVGEPPAA